MTLSDVHTTRLKMVNVSIQYQYHLVDATYRLSMPFARSLEAFADAEITSLMRTRHDRCVHALVDASFHWKMSLALSKQALADAS